MKEYLKPELTLVKQEQSVIMSSSPDIETNVESLFKDSF